VNIMFNSAANTGRDASTRVAEGFMTAFPDPAPASESMRLFWR